MGQIGGKPVSKECSKCGEVKELDYFFKDLTGKFGKSAQCKACRTNRILEYQKTGKGKEVLSKVRLNNNANRKFKHPEKFKARQALADAIRIGKVVKPLIGECGHVGRLVGHHDDYSKPLSVRWLCQKCHSNIHK